MRLPFFMLAAGASLLPPSIPAYAAPQSPEPTEWSLRATLEVSGDDRSLSIEKEFHNKSECIRMVENIKKDVLENFGSNQYHFKWLCKNNTASGEADASGAHSPSPSDDRNSSQKEPPRTPSRPENKGSQSISITCEGYDKIRKQRVDYFFKIDASAQEFSGQENSLRAINGTASVSEAQITMSYRDPVAINMIWIDRNAGKFKIDRTLSSGMYLMDSVVGSCQAFAGRAF